MEFYNNELHDYFRSLGFNYSYEGVMFGDDNFIWTDRPLIEKQIKKNSRIELKNINESSPQLYHRLFTFTDSKSPNEFVYLCVKPTKISPIDIKFDKEITIYKEKQLAYFLDLGYFPDDDSNIYFNKDGKMLSNNDTTLLDKPPKNYKNKFTTKRYEQLKWIESLVKNRGQEEIDAIKDILTKIREKIENNKVENNRISSKIESQLDYLEDFDNHKQIENISFQLHLNRINQFHVSTEISKLEKKYNDIQELYAFAQYTMEKEKDKIAPMEETKEYTLLDL